MNKAWDIYQAVVTSPIFVIFVCLCALVSWALYQISRSRSEKDAQFEDIYKELGLDQFPGKTGQFVVYLWFFLFIIMLSAILFALGTAIWKITTGVGIEQISVSIYALPAMVIPFSALVAFPFTLLRSQDSRRQTEAEEEGLITDRINAAVASLGAEKVVKLEDGKEETRPNIEVRVGAILALERLFLRKPDIYIQILEIYCAYIRETAKHNLVNAANDFPDRIGSFPRPVPRIDLQLTIDVLRRRDPSFSQIEKSQKYRMDFSNTNLAGLDFSKGEFSGALFRNCILEAVNFSKSFLHGTGFQHSNLNFVNLYESEISGANFAFTRWTLPEDDAHFSLASEFKGISVAGANLSTTTSLGSATQTNVTFGSLDTITALGDFPHLRSQSRIESYTQFVANKMTAEDRQNYMETGYAYWQPYDTSDLSTNWNHKQLLDDLGLTDFPYQN